MKHWKEERTWSSHITDDAIVLKRCERVISVSKDGDCINFAEECDGAFGETYTKDEAIELVEELIEWIRGT